MAEEQVIRDVAAEDVEFYTELLQGDGLTVTPQQQSDGTTTLVGSDPAAAPGAPTDPPIAWGRKVTAAFKDKLLQCCTQLQVNPDYLMSAIAFESAGTFSPKALNVRSKATGLIQFMPSTATSLGTTVNALAQMSAVDQLDYVEKYLQPYTGRLNTIEDTYMAILYPAAVGKSDDYVLFSAGSLAYTLNKPLDIDGDGKVTKEEASSGVKKRYELGMSDQYRG